ncbi:baseplate assembly protein [Virgibacillus halodenitrificans]|uniref:baseplate assembly protein n=1 Tax=Virgibacillus halodenitrificans TaxID=1482 RepID=UPI000EF44502|nr:baseplate J/gp47 family protein [Virgibacillus halodenitrificans]
MAITLKDLPDVNFAEKDINKILTDMVSGYEQAYFESTGERKKLYPGDPIRIFLYSQALRELQLRVMIDDAAKQNLLKYARKDNLKHLGAFSRTKLLEPQASTTKQKFILSQARPTDEVILAGTRVSPGDDIYFSTLEDITVPAGQQSITAEVKCQIKGAIGNGFLPGQINILVDPIPWVASVENAETSQGGADEESTEDYRERIHLAPEGFSVAGPEGAYEYFARQYSPLVEDIKITSPSDGVVDIKVLLKNGELPNAGFISDISAYLSAKERRPLTDKVQVTAPVQVKYNLDVTYYISKEKIAQESNIKANIENAILDYEVWQRSKIGRDINPSELVSKIQLAGAKRVTVTAPIYTPVSDDSVAIVDIKTVTYGGLEDE